MKHILLTLCVTAALHAQQPATAPHTFTSTDGRKLTASIIEKTATTVTLRRAEDGKDFILPLDRLSAADQALVKTWGEKPSPSPVPPPSLAEPKTTTSPGGLVKTWMLEPQWDGVGLFGEGLAPVKLGGKWGYINETGKMVIEPTWDEALRFADGLAPVQKDGKWGYIDQTGKVVVELIWDDAAVFSGGAATVVKHGKFGFIDTTGKLISEPKWVNVEDFSHGLAIVNTAAQDEDGTVAVINLKGETILEQARRKYSNPIKISEHGISVIGNRPYNAKGTDQIGKPRTRFMDLTASKVLFERPVERHIDHTGNFVISPAFNAAPDFQNGMAFVERRGLRTTNELADRAIIDTTGAVVVPITRPQSNQLAWFWKGPQSRSEAVPAAGAIRHYGLVDHTGKVIVTPAWDDAEILSPDLVAFKVNGKFGLVNAAGQVVLPATIENIEEVLHHDQTTVKVRQGSQWGLLDIQTGKITPAEKPDYRRAKTTLPDDFAPFQENKLWGVKAKDGNILVAPQYGDMRQASKDRFWVRKTGDGAVDSWALMNQTGQMLTEPEWGPSYSSTAFSDGLALVVKGRPSNRVAGGVSGYMDESGKSVITLSRGRKSSFAHGAAMIWNEKESGLINTMGEWVFKSNAEAELSEIGFTSAFANHFQHGLALIERPLKWGFVKLAQAAK